MPKHQGVCASQYYRWNRRDLEFEVWIYRRYMPSVIFVLIYMKPTPARLPNAPLRILRQGSVISAATYFGVSTSWIGPCRRRPDFHAPPVSHCKRSAVPGGFARSFSYF